MKLERKQYWLDLAKVTLPKHKISFISSSISQIVEELETDEMMAYKQRTYYDELVKAGFSEEQAWEMVRMPFGIPYTPGYAV